MKRWVICFAMAAALPAASWAGPHSFPSNTSTVVGSVGLLDSEKIGYFYSFDLGHKVESVLVDPLPEVNHALFDFAVPENLLDLGAVVQWDVSINAQTVGNFEVHDTFRGPMHLNLTFAPIGNVVGLYTVAFTVTNVVPGGDGCHALAYDGPWPHTVDLIYDPPPSDPVPAPAALLLGGLGAGLVGCLRLRRVL